MKSLFNETSIEIGRKAMVFDTKQIGTIKHVRGTCNDDLVTLEFQDGSTDRFNSMDLQYYYPKVMKMFRIITNGSTYKVQRRKWLIFWFTIQRPEDLDNKDFGGDMNFDNYEDAQKFIERNKKTKYIVVKQ